MTRAVLHGHHRGAHICGLGPDAGAVAIEPVVQQFGSGLLRYRLHWPGSVEIDGIIATKHGLSAEAG